MTIKKAINQIHLWLGLTSGLVVFVLGLTGATYAFIDELRPVFYKDRLFVTPEKTQPLPLSQLLAAAETALKTKPGRQGGNLCPTRPDLHVQVFKAKS